MENVVVKKSKIQGKGVFAARDFKRNESILHVDGKVIKTRDPSSLPKDMQDYCYPFDKKGNVHYYVLPKPPWRYINHSCDPNAGIKNNRDIVAMKKIKKGEEIVFDCAMNNIDEWTMECNCKAKNCRKIISTFDVLDEKTKKKYLNYVIDYIREQYLKK